MFLRASMTLDGKSKPALPAILRFVYPRKFAWTTLAGHCLAGTSQNPIPTNLHKPIGNGPQHSYPMLLQPAHHPGLHDSCYLAVGQNPVTLVNIKIGGKWMFIEFPEGPLPFSRKRKKPSCYHPAKMTGFQLSFLGAK